MPWLILLTSCSYSNCSVIFSSLPRMEMASNILKFHIQTFHRKNPSTIKSKTLVASPLSLHASLSSSTPPTTKEEAILQAKNSLSTTLQKPLNNPKPPSKYKKVKQPRYRIEIPLIDDSPSSLSQLAFDVFKDLPITRKGSSVKILFLWPDTALTEAAVKAFESYSLNPVEHIDMSSLAKGDYTSLSTSADVAVLLAPEESQLAVLKTVTESLYPRPVVIFNPRWGFEDEENFGHLSVFVGSFDVIYSFMGLEVKGILSKRKGVIFKCVRDGVLSGERWNVLVEEEGELKVVSRFKVRPSVGEVETVLYNLMAINSPITKSAKFFRDLVSNVTGKKRRRRRNYPVRQLGIANAGYILGGERNSFIKYPSSMSTNGIQDMLVRT